MHGFCTSERQSKWVGTLCLCAAMWYGAGAAAADTVTDWNQTAIRATEIAGVPLPVQARAMAIVHAAVFDAVNTIERKFAPYAADIKAAPGASPEAAAA